MAQIIQILPYVVATLLLLLASTLLAFQLEVSMEWLPLNFSSLLRLIGGVFILAAVAETVRGRALGKWVFAFLFIYFAYRTFAEDSLPVEYPQDLEWQIRLATIQLLLAFGGLHLAYR